MKKRFLHILLLFLLAVSASAQDIHFSQFFETPLLRNPSLAGIFTGDYRIQTVFRDQWNSFTNAYRTGSLNAEYKWPIGKQSDYLTTALEVFYDKAGAAALQTAELLPALNYHKSLSNDHPSYLSLGFMGGIVQKSIDLSKVTTNSQYNGAAYDPSLPNGEIIHTPNIRYLDGSLGISYNTSYGPGNQNSMYIGFAYHHLNRPKNSFYANPTIGLDPKVVLSLGIRSIINDYSYFTIQGDWSRQGPDQETIGGVLYSYKLGESPDNYLYTFTIGGLVRWKDAFIPIVKLEMNSFTVGLSYDVNTSQLNTVSNSRGGFELSLSYTGFLDRENAKFRTLCPKF
ncbi:MAG TPA: PorP/SprF family type IX secretion system membrane protein [Puia sp.]|nr:PorP/SprF family type IX secretion system membrane protein [Puia sp.]